MQNGSCHCGRIAFEVDADIQTVIACNCSMCQRKGSLLFFVPREKLTLRTPAENLTPYTFNQHRIKHYHCAICGIAPFAEATDREGRPTAAINARCIEGFDPQTADIKHVDGRSF